MNMNTEYPEIHHLDLLSRRIRSLERAIDILIDFEIRSSREVSSTQQRQKLEINKRKLIADFGLVVHFELFYEYQRVQRIMGVNVRERGRLETVKEALRHASIESLHALYQSAQELAAKVENEADVIAWHERTEMLKAFLDHKLQESPHLSKANVGEVYQSWISKFYEQISIQRPDENNVEIVVGLMLSLPNYEDDYYVKYMRSDDQARGIESDHRIGSPQTKSSPSKTPSNTSEAQLLSSEHQSSELE